MACVLKIVMPFDKTKLMLDKTVKQITAMIQSEDRSAAQSTKNRAMTTANSLYDGDPMKVDLFVSKGDGNYDFNKSYLSKLRSRIIAASKLADKL